MSDIPEIPGSRLMYDHWRELSALARRMTGEGKERIEARAAVSKRLYEESVEKEMQAAQDG